jgi:glycosyltransferase involved in cell wall biosynthesis
MRLLLVTFELNTASKVLAWQARLASALAQKCEHIVLLTESLGAFTPAANVTVVKVPAMFTGPLRLFGAAWIMNAVVYKLCRRHRIEVCFVHMATQWTYRLRPALALAGVPAALWYAHGTVSRRLRLAHKCAARILTSSPEGFRIPSRKVRIIGQGIDTDVFRIPQERVSSSEFVYVGRVSPRKRLELVIDVFSRARSHRPSENFTLQLIGPCLNDSDRKYRRAMVERIDAHGLTEHVTWCDFMPPHEMETVYRKVAVHLNLSATGSLDKTVLEALACGCPVFTNNPPFRAVLGDMPIMYSSSDDPDTLAQLLLNLYDARRSINPTRLRQIVLDSHSFDVYVNRVAAELAAIADLGPRHR